MIGTAIICWFYGIQNGNIRHIVNNRYNSKISATLTISDIISYQISDTSNFDMIFKYCTNQYLKPWYCYITSNFFKCRNHLKWFPFKLSLTKATFNFTQIHYPDLLAYFHLSISAFPFWVYSSFRLCSCQYLTYKALLVM